MTASADQARRPPREQWADVAKGVCIVLVVLWHVTRKDYLQLPWQLDVPVTGAWGTFSEVLLPVRMPLFFCISGLFAARRLRDPWPAVWSGRVAPLLHLFVLWTLLHTALFRLTPGFDTAVADSPRELLVQLTVTPGDVWYLLALATYVAVARATRRVPRTALLAALVLSTVAAAGLVSTPGNRAGLLVNLTFFLLGVQVAAAPGSARWVAWLRPRRTPALVGAVAVFVVAAAAWQLADADGWPGARPALDLLGIAAGAGVAVRLARLRRLGPALARLGRLTLPVYVLHLPLVALLHVASTRLMTHPSSLPLAVAYPAAATAAVVAACLVLHRVLVGLRLGWLFQAPWHRRVAPDVAARVAAISR